MLAAEVEASIGAGTVQEVWAAMLQAADGDARFAQHILDHASQEPVTLALWDRPRQVHLLDADLADALAGSVDDTTPIPGSLLRRLPHPTRASSCPPRSSPSATTGHRSTTRRCSCTATSTAIRSTAR